MTYHSFAEYGDVEDPKRCKWCGRKLRKARHFIFVADGKVIDETRPGKRGDYGDGHFCGLSCGYHFGCQLADHGRALRVVK